MITLYGLFQAASKTRNVEYRKYIVAYINRKLRPTRRLPFVVYLSEDSSPDKLIFRVVHRTAHTSNKVYVTVKEATRWSLRTLNVDASDGSNWHHLKFEFVSWFKSQLSMVVADSFIESLMEVA